MRGELYCVTETCRYNRLKTFHAISLSKLRDTRRTRLSTLGTGPVREALLRRFGASLPPLRHALGNQCLGERILEVRALPPLLPPGIDQMDHAVLSSDALDAIPASDRSHSPAMPGLSLQFRHLQTGTRKFRVASPGSSRTSSASARPRVCRHCDGTNPARGGIWGSDAITGSTRGVP